MMLASGIETFTDLFEKVRFYSGTSEDKEIPLRHHKETKLSWQAIFRFSQNGFHRYNRFQLLNFTLYPVTMEKSNCQDNTLMLNDDQGFSGP